MNLWKKSAAMIIFVCGVASGFAQQMPPVPTDPNVRIGKLENGLTYYIRHNELPENQADFYIAQKVGSILKKTTREVLPTSWSTCVSTVPQTIRETCLENIWSQ